MATQVLKHCRVSPLPGAVAERSVPLTFFDMRWINLHPVSLLISYDIPCSTSHFTQIIVPDLKHSLSVALKRFYTLAGNLIVPSGTSSKLPKIRYSEGDSVAITFAKCSNDFTHLAGNHPRKVDELFPLVPPLPTPVTSGDCLVAPLLALQVTLFPNHGITVGFTIDHVVADASAMSNFTSTWASITKLGRDDEPSLQLPFYDRSVIKDPKGLSTKFWSQWGKTKKIASFGSSQPAKLDQVRATFVMSRAHIQRLKDLVAKRRPRLAHVSSFTVVCAYTWTCMAKARAAVNNGEEVLEDEIEHFVFAMNCRRRLDVPIPATYFGNCLATCWTSRKMAQLMEEEGFVNTAEVIGEAIHAKVHNEDGGVLKDAELWIEEIIATYKKMGHRLFGVSGSPNFDFYSFDFGWGKPKKVEVVSEKFSLLGCKDSQGDIEVGICFPKNEMDAFSTIFNKGLI